MVNLPFRLTAIAPARGLGVSHKILPVALSKAAHNPFIVVLGLPGLGLKTGAGDDLHNAEIPLVVITTAALTIDMSAGGADLYSRNNVWKMVMRLLTYWVIRNSSNRLHLAACIAKAVNSIQSVVCAIRHCTHATAIYAVLH